MGWSILNQPNGQLARFSKVVDDFTHINMDEEEAFKCCQQQGLSRQEASKKILGAQQDTPYYGEPKTEHDGLSRYRYAIKMVALVHGNDRVNEVKALMEAPSNP